MIWICEPGQLPHKIPIESHNASGLRLEMQTFLERYRGDTLDVCVYESPTVEGSRLACAIVRELVHCRTIHTRGKTIYCNPFSTPFHGAVTIHYAPAWYVPLERDQTIRGICADDYASSTLPSTIN